MVNRTKKTKKTWIFYEIKVVNVQDRIFSEIIKSFVRKRKFSVKSNIHENNFKKKKEVFLDSGSQAELSQSICFYSILFALFV